MAQYKQHSISRRTFAKALAALPVALAPTAASAKSKSAPVIENDYVSIELAEHVSGRCSSLKKEKEDSKSDTWTVVHEESSELKGTVLITMSKKPTEGADKLFNDTANKDLAIQALAAELGLKPITTEVHEVKVGKNPCLVYDIVALDTSIALAVIPIGNGDGINIMAVYNFLDAGLFGLYLSFVLRDNTKIISAEGGTTQQATGVGQSTTSNGAGPVLDEDACIGCQLCMDACPDGTITFDKKTQIVVLPASCSLCGACAEICPTCCIEMP